MGTMKEQIQQLQRRLLQSLVKIAERFEEDDNVVSDVIRDMVARGDWPPPPKDPPVVMSECAKCGMIWVDGEDPQHLSDCGVHVPPPPPEGPPNETVREDDTTPRALPLVPLWGSTPLASAIAKGLQPQPFQKRRLPAKVRTCIESALKRADSKLRTRCGVDPTAQELMRLYLDTWVAGPLRTVLDWDDGNDSPFPNWD